MKIFITTIVTAFALVLAARADDVTAKITNVHLCCGKCVAGAKKIVGTVDGAKADISQADGTITITAADKATTQKVADALIAGGFFGMSSDVKMDDSTGAKGAKVQTLTVTGVHLCCGKCVKAVDTAVKAVPGVTGETAAQGAESFTVTGDFNDKDVFDALQKAGLTGKVGK
jgi:copper chaperone CopZ